MYKAIIAKYLPPTNTKSSRIVVKIDGRPSKTYSYHHGLNVADNLELFANRYNAELGMDHEDYTLVGGELPGNAGHAFVTVRKGTV